MRNREGLSGLGAILIMIGSAHGEVAGSAGSTLEEVVVYAQKRSENLQQVPIALTAVTAESLARSGVSTTQDLAFVAPSLVYSRTGAYAQPYLRGVGSELTNANADPSVTTYVDGVVVSTTAGLIQELLGVERVEVSAGPQGTLNGRNATAGAISIYTLTPSHTPQAEVKASYGNYDSKEFSGFLSGGLSESLALGVYAGFADRDSYLTQLGNPLRPSSERNWGGRLKAVYTPDDAIKLTGSVEYTETKSMEAGAFRNAQNPNLGVTLGIPNAVQPPYVVNNGPNANSGFAAVNNTVFASTLREEVDFGWARLLGITGYRNLSRCRAMIWTELRSRSWRP
jgi:iron complex outermembrane recepter protein